MLDLAIDPLDETGPDRVRGHEQPVVVGVHRVAGQDVEEVRNVLADLVVAREKAEILVEARGLGVVVARPEVAVAAQPVAVVADNERELAVRLEPDQAVDDVDAGLLELLAPVDVVLLIEAGLDLHQGQHLLAVAGSLDECLHDGGVPARPVERLLDREDMRVRCRLLEEELHARGERVVGVVHQDVLLAHLRDDVGCGRGLDLGKRPAGAGDEARLLEVVAVDGVERPQSREVEWPGEAEDLGLAHIEFLHEQLEDVGVDGALDLEPHGRAEAAPGELALECLQQVLRVVFLDLDVLIAGHPEGVVLEDVHAREEVLQMGGDHVLEGHEALGIDPHEARQRRWHLDAREELGARDGIAHDHGEIE